MAHLKLLVPVAILLLQLLWNIWSLVCLSMHDADVDSLTQQRDFCSVGLQCLHFMMVHLFNMWSCSMFLFNWAKYHMGWGERLNGSFLWFHQLARWRNDSEYGTDWHVLILTQENNSCIHIINRCCRDKILFHWSTSSVRQTNISHMYNGVQKYTFEKCF